MGYGTVVNYRSNVDVEVFAGETESTKHGPAIVSVSRTDARRPPPEQSDEAGGLDDYVIWDQGRLVAFGVDNAQATSIRRADDQRYPGRTRSIANYDSSLGKIINVVRVGRSFALEGRDKLRLVTPEGALDLATGGVISLRSYPRSFRYRRLITATSETGLWLIGVDDRDFESRS